MISILIAIPLLPLLAPRTDLFFVEVKLRSDTRGHLQIYFDTGSGFHEALSARAEVPPGPEFTQFSLPLPKGTYWALRLDPLDTPAALTLSTFRVVTGSGRVLQDIAITDFKPAYQIDRLTPQADGLEIVPAAPGTDPQLRVDLTAPLIAQRSWSDFFATLWRPAAGIFAGIVVLLFALEQFLALRTDRPAAPPLPRAQRIVLIAAVLLAIWGAKLVVIDLFGSDVPYWDQWPREAELTFVPFFERGEFWKLIFDVHNEHRIAPTILTNLGLVVASNQWDARVQCVVNGLIHTIVALGLLGWAFRRLTRGWALASAMLVVFVFAPPIASENILAGFQSQFYFLIGFSLLAIGGVLGSSAFSRRWWLGLASGLVAVVSMGSGFLCAAPIAIVAGVRLLRREARRDALGALAAALAIAALGGWLYTPAPGHAAMHAHTLAEFFLYASRCLSWPLFDVPWLGALLWLPWLALLGQRLARLRGEADGAADFVLAGGGWVLLQVAAISYGRGGATPLPSARYGDIFAIGLTFAFFALALLGRNAPARRSATAGWAWFALAIGCLAFATHQVWQTDMPSKKAENTAYERNVSAFVLSDDIAPFDAIGTLDVAGVHKQLPFPSPAWLAERLRQAPIRTRLPASIAPPVANRAIQAASRPPAPPLPQRQVQVVSAPGEWRSAPFSPATGWWKIETAGAVGSASASLTVESVASGRVLATIAPSRPAGNSWRAAYVPAPREPAVIVAHVQAEDTWLAFSDPIGMSGLSYRAWVLAKYGAWIAMGGVALGAAALWRWRIRA